MVDYRGNLTGATSAAMGLYSQNLMRGYGHAADSITRAGETAARNIGRGMESAVNNFMQKWEEGEELRETSRFWKDMPKKDGKIPETPPAVETSMAKPYGSQSTPDTEMSDEIFRQKTDTLQGKIAALGAMPGRASEQQALSKELSDLRVAHAKRSGDTGAPEQGLLRTVTRKEVLEHYKSLAQQRVSAYAAGEPATAYRMEQEIADLRGHNPELFARVDEAARSRNPRVRRMAVGYAEADFRAEIEKAMPGARRELLDSHSAIHKVAKGWSPAAAKVDQEVQAGTQIDKLPEESKRAWFVERSSNPLVRARSAKAYELAGAGNITKESEFNDALSTVLTAEATNQGAAVDMAVKITGRLGVPEQGLQLLRDTISGVAAPVYDEGVADAVARYAPAEKPDLDAAGQQSLLERLGKEPDVTKKREMAREAGYEFDPTKNHLSKVRVNKVSLYNQTEARLSVYPVPVKNAILRTFYSNLNFIPTEAREDSPAPMRTGMDFSAKLETAIQAVEKRDKRDVGGAFAEYMAPKSGGGK